MSKVIIDINILRTVLREYFTEPFYHQLMGDLNDNEVFVKDCCPEDFSPCEIGEKGIIQVVSSLARSYPGHSILTEDEGVILGEDDCPCGRNGKYIQVLGRIKQAELRGCSDTYAAKF